MANGTAPSIKPISHSSQGRGVEMAKRTAITHPFPIPFSILMYNEVIGNYSVAPGVMPLHGYYSANVSRRLGRLRRRMTYIRTVMAAWFR